MRRWAEPTLALILLAGCESDEEETYVQFNADDEALSVEVGAAEAGEPSSITLHSTTGEIEIGTATVDPGSGPIGTEHTITVEIFNNYEHMVDRVSVRTDSGDRGEDEFDLRPDSADEGYYERALVSVGEDGEQRTDTLTIFVWDVEGDEDGEAGTEDSGEDTAGSDDTGS